MSIYEIIALFPHALERPTNNFRHVECCHCCQLKLLPFLSVEYAAVIVSTEWKPYLNPAPNAKNFYKSEEESSAVLVQEHVGRRQSTYLIYQWNCENEICLLLGHSGFSQRCGWAFWFLGCGAVCVCVGGRGSHWPSHTVSLAWRHLLS